MDRTAYHPFGNPSANLNSDAHLHNHDNAYIHPYTDRHTDQYADEHTNEYTDQYGHQHTHEYADEHPDALNLAGYNLRSCITNPAHLWVKPVSGIARR